MIDEFGIALQTDIHYSVAGLSQGFKFQYFF